ncbi:hypothetical protein FRB99_003263 [Tulasnella sp. 403]|nr:hypothetical protein FRB99_003263 [Tulasnella sp. 403]
MARPNAFSVYASHFINASNALNRSFYREPDTPEPLFFSVTEGSHLAQSKDSLPPDATTHDDQTSDVDEDGYPKLMGSGGSVLRRVDSDDDADQDPFRAGPSTSYHHKAQPVKKPSDDPYLDDADLEEELGVHPGVDSIPLIASGARSPVRTVAAPAPGWLAHFSTSRQPSKLHVQDHSPLSSPASSPSSPSSNRSSESSEPPPFLPRGHTPPPTRTTLSESLLPRDGISRSLFSLPDPRRIPRRKYNDSPWTVLWCTAILVCGVASIFVLFIPVSPSLPEKSPSPYSTITRAIPLLTFIVLLSSVISYAHLVLLRYAVRPVLIATGLAVPFCLFIGSAWSFAGSFFTEDGAQPTWGESVGAEPEPARPTPLVAAQAAFARAHGPSLGSICVATLVLAFTRSTIFVLRSLRRITTPPQLAFLAPLHPLEWLSTLIAILDSLGEYALTYIGITGDPFWHGARRARELMNSGGKSGRAKGTRAGDYAFLSTLLTLSSLSIALVMAIGGYIFAAHTLLGPNNAILMALLTGGVTFMTVQFGVGVGEDAADALYVCYCMDMDAGTQHCKDAFDAFEGKNRLPPDEP